MRELKNHLPTVARLALSLAIGAVVFAAAVDSGFADSPTPAARHVVVIGVDGMSPAGVRDATTPTMDKLREQGAFTMQARAVMKTSSSPNWASMIMGAGPEQHGVISNGWQRDRFEIAPVVKGPEGIYPTMFSVLRQNRPESVIGVFYDWDDFGRLVEGKSCDKLEDADGPVDALGRGVAFWNSTKPTLTFVHLDHVDNAGHAEGWGSPAYLQAVQEADRLIGQFVAAIEASGLEDETVLIVTSDHGGIGKGHGGATMAELEIPWIACGAGIRTGVELENPVNTFDTAPSVLRALGVPRPEYWVGRPVEEAFVETP